MEKNQLTTKVRNKLSIQAKPELLKGMYANALKVNVSNTEVVLDFAFVYEKGAEENRGEMVARVILPALFAKKAINSVLGVIDAHEKSLKNASDEKPRTDK